MKICRKCNLEKALSEFHNHITSKDGYRNECKSCYKEYQKKYRKANEDKIKVYEKKRYELNRETILKNRKDYRDSNQDKIRDKKKKYYQDNLQYIKERDKKYYQENRDKILKRNKKYRESNIDSIREWRKEYDRVRYQNDSLYRIKRNLSRRTKQAFNNKKWIKKGGTEQLLGANYITVFNHIESRFRDGMNWDNQGEWQIDHIIPLSSAKTEEELIELCHYTNLQPLWSEDNLKKSDNIIACRINL